MIKPRKLIKKSLIALVNPTGRIPIKFASQENYSYNYLIKEGYNPKKFLVDYESSKEERAEVFNIAVNSSARALFPIGDSKGAGDILSLIDYKKFSEKRPIFVGFSSLSSLLAILNQRAETLVFYGPHIAFLNDNASLKENRYTNASFWNILTGNSFARGLGSLLSGYIFRFGNKEIGLKNIHYYLPEIDSEIKFEGYNSGYIRGNLLASALEGLIELSELDYDFKNKIVIADSIGINFREAAEKLKKIKEKTNAKEMAALVIASLKSRSDKGQLETFPELQDDSKRKEFLCEVRKIFGENIPVLYGFPSGHGRYKLTIPLGIQSRLDLKTGDIYFEEPIWKEDVKSIE